MGPDEMFAGARLPVSTTLGLFFVVFFSTGWKKDIQNF